MQMSQRALARALGLSEAAVSTLKKRGMPVEAGVEACRAWRNRNVAPYARSAAAPAASTDATDAEMLALLEDAAVMPSADVLAIVGTLGKLAGELLPAGRLGEVEHALRAALRAVPSHLRPQVALPLPVFEALTAAVLATIEASFPTPEARAEDRQRAEAATAESREWMGGFWYRVAAGECAVRGA